MSAGDKNKQMSPNTLSKIIWSLAKGKDWKEGKYLKEKEIREEVGGDGQEH